MRNNGLNPRVLLGLVLIVVVAGGVAVAAIGGQGGEQAKHAQALAEHFDAAEVLEPAKPAPALELHNYLGQPVNIDSYRGKAVLVTFLYTNCPDICPLITSNLRVALNKLGPAG
ncbi:MAG TPA: SCO family protein, partial [Solirubrobacteraceae bacterium]|nr:SCO family protein [Solirubrobacteraceae bacterium]